MKNREDVFDPTTVGVYHVFTRCVQKLDLLGFDPLTGTTTSRRRDRAVADLKRFARFYAFEVLDFTIMENHLHLLVRCRPDIAATWPALEVVTRWWYVHPKRKKKNGEAKDPTAKDLQPWLSDKAYVETLRRRLCHLSWLMWDFLGKIARDCNKEAKTDGRFFSRRFKCKKIDDLGGLLACSMYVVLNPARANMVDLPENYAHSSLKLRIAGQMQRHQRELGREVEGEDADAWLSALFLDERAVAYNATVEEVDGEPQWTPQRNPLGAPRCSNKGYMPLELPKFIDVAHWTAENVHSKKRAEAQGKEWEPSPIPPEMEQLLRSVGIPTDRWCTLVEEFESLFNFYVGTPEQIATAAERLRQKWLKGKGSCETYLGQFEPPIFLLSEAESQYRAGSSPAAGGNHDDPDAGPPPASP